MRILVLCVIIAVGSPQTSAQEQNMESFTYSGDLCDYECFYRRGEYDKQILQNTLSLFKGNERIIFINKENSVEENKAIYRNKLKEIAELQIIETSIWQLFKDQIYYYDSLRYDLLVIKQEIQQNPKALLEYDGLYLDSMLVKCANVLINSSDQEIVANTRQYMHELIYALAQVNKTP